MSIEPKELSPEQIETIRVLDRGLYDKVALLAHIEHQSRQLAALHAECVGLRAELARTAAERDSLSELVHIAVIEKDGADERAEKAEARVAELEKHNSTLLDAEMRIAELESALDETLKGTWPPSELATRVIKALTESGKAEKQCPECNGCGNKAGVPFADPDPCPACGTSGRVAVAAHEPQGVERRTRYEPQVLTARGAWQAVRVGWKTDSVEKAATWFKGLGSSARRIVRVTEIRDVIAAGEKEGGSK